MARARISHGWFHPRDRYGGTLTRDRGLPTHSTLPPSLRECGRRYSAAPTTIRHPRHRPGYVGVDSTPFAGRASSSGAGCSQPAWLFEDARDGRLVGDVGQDLEWTPAGFAHEGVRLVDLADEPKDRPPCAGRLFGQMKTPMASPLAGASVAVAADESAYGSVLLARPGTASLELPSLG